MTEETKTEVDWNRWEGERFVKMIAGKPKVLTCESVKDTNTEITDKRSGDTKQIPCLNFKVSNEDGEKTDKEWSVTSKLLAKALRPLVEKGFPFTVKVTQFGSGFETTYEIQEQASGDAAPATPTGARGV